MQGAPPQSATNSRGRSRILLSFRLPFTTVLLNFETSRTGRYKFNISLTCYTCQDRQSDSGLLLLGKKKCYCILAATGLGITHVAVTWLLTTVNTPRFLSLQCRYILESNMYTCSFLREISLLGKWKR